MAGEQPELTEDDVNAMVLETEQEIFDEATGDEPAENTGDRSLEEMDDDELEASPDEEGEQEAPTEEAGESEDEEASAEPAAQEERRPPGNVPYQRFREEGERRREAETALANERERIAALEARFNDFMARSQQLPPQPQKPTSRPDMFADSEGWEKSVRSEIRSELEKNINERFLNSSLATAHEEHGAEFEQAYRSLTTLDPNDPRNRATVQSIINAPNPGRSLMKWYEPQLTAFREEQQQREQERFDSWLETREGRQYALAKLRSDATANGRRTEPRTPRMPPSLNATPGGSQRITDPELYNDTDRSVFDFATR